MSTLQVNSILDSSGGNSAIINGTYIRPGALDPDNRVINGAFDFWQWGTSSTANAYNTADRWGQSVIGGTVTQSRQSFSLGDTFGSNSPTFFMRQTVSGQTLASHAANVFQRIEGVRSYAGQTITLLGWARRSSGSGNMAVAVDQRFGTGGSPSAQVNGTGQIVNLTSSWEPFALTFSVPSITGKTLGTNGDDALQIVFWTSAGSDFNARTNSLGLQTIGVDLWGIHIKVGTHTTAAVDLYRQPELGLELARCQRYFQRFLVPVEWTSGLSSSVIYRSYTYPVTMRTIPAVTTQATPSGYTTTGSALTMTTFGATLVRDQFVTIVGNAAGIAGWAAGGILHMDAEL